MTTPPSAQQGTLHTFDTGPLSWVMGEIREALNRSKTALQEAVMQDADAQSTSLRHARSYLHQAHGALQIVDIDGVAIITETVEDLLDRVMSGQLALTDALGQAIGHGYQALTEYLEELLSGAPHQPVRLFPYYRALLEARGAERIHPADLFFPNLAIRPQLPASASSRSLDANQYLGLRKRFEKALLPFLKSSDPAAERANAGAMRDVIGEIEQAQSNVQTRSFWWVMHGLAEAVAAGQIPNEIYVKQLFARINLQMRRLSQGSSSIAERLLRDALFFIARTTDPSPRARQIRAAYQLDGLVPADYATKRYGRIDVDALAGAKERLTQAKNIWNRIAGGDAGAADSFEHEMRMLADAGSKLNSPPLSKLLRELKGIARHAAHARPGDLLGLEMATSLLFVENALNHIGRLPENFAERADAMTARLLAVVAGEPLMEATGWLDDMSRQAQQRQTMTALATEMQNSLRQVEKTLDEYFRDPQQAASLSQLDGILHQIEGALAVLDQDDAVRAVGHTRAAIRGFTAAEAGTGPDQQAFQQVAQNIGALSFFIESLQREADAAKQRFIFDEELGLFQAKLLERPVAADTSPDTHPEAVASMGDSPGLPLAEAPPEVATVEDELARRQRESAELALSLTEQPDNPALQEQLKESLEKMRLDAALLDNPDVNDKVQAGIEALTRPDFPSSPEAMQQVISATATAEPASEPLPVIVAPESDAAIDAELLEIFLSEAEEVLAAAEHALPLSRNEPHSQEHLTTLRRCFHTLKGSGRMVGLTAFGEAAWSIEQVLNLRLSEARSGDSELYALLDKATETLGAWVQDLKTHGKSERTPQALVAAAERVKAGEPFAYEENVAPEGGMAPAFVVNAENSSTVEEGDNENAAAGATTGPADLTPGGLDPAIAAEHGDAHEAALDALGMTSGELPPEEAFDALPPLEPAEEIRLSDAEFAAFEEDPPALATVARLPEPPFRPEVPVPRAASAVAIAEVIEFPTLQPAEAKIDDNVKRIGELEISVPLHNIYLAETDELVRMLAQDIGEWRHEPDRQVNIQAVHAAHSLAGSSATVGFNALHEVAHALEMVLQFLSRQPVRLLTHEFDTLEQTVERMKLMLQKFALGEMPVYLPEYARLLASMRQDIEARLDGAGDTLLSRIEPAEVPPAASIPANDMSAMPADRAAAAADTLPVTLPAVDGEEDATEADPVLQDDLDLDLLPVFFEEGRDILPQMGANLRIWVAEPSNPAMPQSLLRSLHTLKGSARMAGAMALGQHLHDMEARIENLMRLGAPARIALEDLLVRYDHALQMFEHLQNPDTPAPQLDLPVEPAAAEPDAAAAKAHVPVSPQPVVPVPTMPLPAAEPGEPLAISPANAPAASAPLVRVRADILDRLVNQAGEVSISRAKLETEVGALRQSLSELTENVGRLRDQLREIEMQAETQIASQMAHSADREFDPLEFDRFTRLQELTRMMAESVNDVSSVHHNLNRSLDNAVGDLAAQARLTRDLQQDLMRVRMVQFASISERLFRVTRQAAKELDKRVNLDIRGSAVEIDRGVLEKMTGPFEHLLRNAVVHGIESREARRAAGKPETGELLVEIRQEGNEVVIEFSDDGQGLNVARIRDKARHIGLLASDGDMSDEEVTDLIFHPGFSTADEVTELAGRGVGMDVVRSEAAALGGRVSTWSEPGKGTHFRIHLPLTLAVTQVVLLTSGGVTYAVPSVLVEQVQHLKTNALATAYNDGAIAWQGQRVPMYYLPALLGDTSGTPTAQQYSPLLILKSGSDRVAIHVDEVIGNREVVVKNIGPQLARLIGIAGATVLGSGNIVLIINPLPLAQRAAQENLRAPRVLSSDAPEHMGAVAEFAAGALAAPQSEPVQGLRTQSIVMVVDDSLTVRRVTQRLLAREGYQVVLAKDGVDALEHLQSLTPDVMLVDIEMPRMDGFDLTRNVRSDERTRHIPIVMITSRTAAKHRNYALELGVNEYLGKPYREDELLQLIAGYVGREAPAV